MPIEQTLPEGAPAMESFTPDPKPADVNVVELEPISQEIKAESFGAFTPRVQKLLDLCGYDLSEELSGALLHCRSTQDLEAALENLEAFAKRIELGNPKDGPKTKEARRGVFRKHIEELLIPTVEPLPELKQRDFDSKDISGT